MVINNQIWIVNFQIILIAIKKIINNNLNKVKIPIRT
jgi:hypothetical protein